MNSSNRQNNSKPKNRTKTISSDISGIYSKPRFQVLNGCANEKRAKYLNNLMFQHLRMILGTQKFKIWITYPSLNTKQPYFIHTAIL